MIEYPDEVTEVQWRVIWFPPDKPDQTYIGTEGNVRRKAEYHAEWNPIIERREVIAKSWEAAE